MDQNRYLQGILGKIESVQEQKRDSLFVFDLDGTLYNNAPRTLRIIQEYAHQYAFMKPEVLEAVDRISVHQVQYRVADTLHAAGIDDPTYRKELQDFWFQRFFTNEYLLYDLPTEGAVEFVNAVYEMGAIPAYLTGRDAPNMLVGTIQTLQRDGFPVGTVDARVILKPQFEMGDTA
ncbi:MAG: HAD family hydrolase [Myxococcota bacterium]